MSKLPQHLSAEFLKEDDGTPRFALVCPRKMTAKVAKEFFHIMEKTFVDDDEKFCFEVRFFSNCPSGVGLLKTPLWEFFDDYSVVANAIYNNSQKGLVCKANASDFVTGLFENLEEIIVYITMESRAPINSPVMEVYLGTPKVVQDEDASETSSSSSSESSSESEPVSKRKRRKSGGE